MGALLWSWSWEHTCQQRCCLAQQAARCRPAGTPHNTHFILQQASPGPRSVRTVLAWLSAARVLPSQPVSQPASHTDRQTGRGTHNNSHMATDTQTERERERGVMLLAHLRRGDEVVQVHNLQRAGEILRHPSLAVLPQPSSPAVQSIVRRRRKQGDQTAGAGATGCCSSLIGVIGKTHWKIAGSAHHLESRRRRTHEYY